MHESIVFCSACTMSQRKFTFAISSPDKFLDNVHVLRVFLCSRIISCLNCILSVYE